MAIGWFTAGAQALTCEPLYRFAYVEFSKHGDPGLREASDIYLMHFDFSNGISQVYAEARPLFAALNTPPAQEDRVLGLLVSKMKNGELCPGGKTLGYMQTAELLRTSLQN
jgi:hypothetical protein